MARRSRGKLMAFTALALGLAITIAAAVTWYRK